MKTNDSWTGDKELDELIDGKAPDGKDKADGAQDLSCVLSCLPIIIIFLVILGILIRGLMISG